MEKNENIYCRKIISNKVVQVLGPRGGGAKILLAEALIAITATGQ